MAKRISMDIPKENIRDNKGEVVKDAKPEEVFKNIVMFAFNSTFAVSFNKRGANIYQIRMYNKIMDAVSEAIKAEEIEFEIEDDWYNFLKKTVLDCNYPVGDAKSIEAVVSNIEKAIDPKELIS